MASDKSQTDKDNSETSSGASAATGWHHPQAIVECDWLKSQLDNPTIRIFDCTTYLHFTDDHPEKPYEVKSGLSKYQKAHIPNSAYLDLQKDLLSIVHVAVTSGFRTDTVAKIESCSVLIPRRASWMTCEYT